MPTSRLWCLMRSVCLVVNTETDDFSGRAVAGRIVSLVVSLEIVRGGKQ